MCGDQRSAFESLFFFHHVGPWDQAEVVGPGYKHLYLLNHLNGPVVVHSINLLSAWDDLGPHLYLGDSESFFH